MKGAMWIMVLLFVLAIPLTAAPALGDTVAKVFYGVSTNFKEGIEQESVTAILFENQALVPDDRKKIIPLLEYTVVPTTGAVNNLKNTVMLHRQKTRKYGRIKSGGL